MLKGQMAKWPAALPNKAEEPRKQCLTTQTLPFFLGEPWLSRSPSSCQPYSRTPHLPHACSPHEKLSVIESSCYWMRAGAHQKGQRGIGSKGQDIVENTKNPSSVHVSHRQVLQDRQGTWSIGRWVRNPQCIQVVCVGGDMSEASLAFIFVCVLVPPWGSGAGDLNGQISALGKVVTDSWSLAMTPV